MQKQHKGIFRIGTSGIVVPGSRQSFPIEFRDKSRLNYYGSLFNTLEVNSTFRKLPMLSTFEKWALEVPEDFQFTIKLWKEITHIKQLKIDFENVDIFFNAVQHIGEKKGCLLIQFPGSITSEYRDKVTQILSRLQELDSGQHWRKAVEFRSADWYNSETTFLLAKYDVSMVFHDMPKSNNLALSEGEKFVYLRYHGPKGDYRGSYSTEFLQEQAKKIRNFLSEGKDVYTYFNNTMGSAFENAATLAKMVKTETD